MSATPYAKGAHVLRKADHKPRKKVAPLPAREYPAGFFTELVVLHDWPPRFASRWTDERNYLPQAKASRALRESGRGFAAVALGLPGATPYISRPLNFGSLGKAGSR